MASPKLNRNQQLFVAEYLKDLNATRAAIASGYSKKTAVVQGSRLLTNANVALAVSNGAKKHLDKAEITAERVLGELAKLAFMDPRNLYNPDGSLKQITELDADTAACIAGFDVEDLYEHFKQGGAKKIGIIKKIKFADKGQNLERLGRWLKLFTDKHEVTGKDGGPIQVKDLSDTEINERIDSIKQQLGLTAAVGDVGRTVAVAAGAERPV